MAHTPRTTCARRDCGRPLTVAQIRRNCQYCSRSCAKFVYHAAHPDAATAAGRRSWELVGRRRFVAQLAVALKGCMSKVEAYIRGRHTGSARSYRRGFADGWEACAREMTAAMAEHTSSGRTAA